MFQQASAFNGDVTTWTINTSSPVSMARMFDRANLFNQDISGWNVSQVTSMLVMLGGSNFDQDISGWNVGNVTNFSFMFQSCPFNRDIDGWNVSSGQTFNNMFTNNTAFDFDLASWNLSSATNLTNMFSNASGLSDANVSATLIGWEAAATTASGVNASSCWGNRTMSATTYATAKTAYDNLVSVKGWNLTNAINWV